MVIQGRSKVEYCHTLMEQRAMWFRIHLNPCVSPSAMHALLMVRLGCSERGDKPLAQVQVV